MTVYTFTFDPPVAYVDRYGRNRLMDEFEADFFWVADDDDRTVVEVIERMASGRTRITKKVTTERSVPVALPFLNSEADFGPQFTRAFLNNELEETR